MSIPIRVAIVADGDPRLDEKDKYREQAELFARNLNRMNWATGDKGRKFDAVVVETYEHAVNSHLSIVGPRALVFISGYFMEQAKLLALGFGSDIRVYVLTGLPPDRQPMIIDKGWLAHASLGDLIS